MTDLLAKQLQILKECKTPNADGFTSLLRKTQSARRRKHKKQQTKKQRGLRSSSSRRKQQSDRCARTYRTSSRSLTNLA